MIILKTSKGEMATVKSFQNRAAYNTVLALCLQTCYVLGTIKSVGVYLPELEVDLGITISDIGLALGLFEAFAFGPGPVVAYLYQRLHGGYRRLLVITGACLAPGGLLLASLVTSNIELATCLSAAGLGSCILSMCFVIALSEQCNEESFSVFYGIGKSGYAFGMALVPLLANYLMEIYGWRGSLMIIGGIMAHLIPLAMMVDVEEGSRRSIRKDDETLSDSLNTAKEDTGLLQRRHAHRTSCAENPEELLDVIPEGPEVLQESSMGQQETETEARFYNQGDNINNCIDNEYLDPEFYRDDESLMKTSSTYQRHQELTDWSCQNKRFAHLLNCSEIYDTLVRVLKNSIYNRDRWLILLMCATMVFGMLDGGWHAFLIPRAVSRGISTTNALSLAYSAAVASFIGRCFGGLLLKAKFFSGQHWFLFLTLLNITSLLADIFFPEFAVMVVASFIESLTVAERNILILVICKDRVPQSHFPVILASSEIVFGVGTFLGASLSGLVADRTGTFNASFMFIAAVDVLVFFLMIPPTIIRNQNKVK